MTNKRKNERGAALMETAMVLPLLLLVAVGIFEFGRAYQTWQVLTNAAREGARFAAMPGAQNEDISAVVKKYMEDGGLPVPEGWTPTIERTVAMPAGSGSKISIAYPFEFMVLQPVMQLVVPGAKTGEPITMGATALMRNEAPM
jgi:hypothetical protein